MSSSNSTSGPGAVRNLRALFENKPSEDTFTSPPSRGRSPAHSEASIQSRPVSKVRASFVAVERPSDIEGGQQWGLRKASDLIIMADTKPEQEKSSLVNGASHTPEPPCELDGMPSDINPVPQPEGVPSDIDPVPQPDGVPSDIDPVPQPDGVPSDIDPVPQPDGVPSDIDPVPQPDGVPSEIDPASQSNGTPGNIDLASQQSPANEITQGGLGGILKGSAFEPSMRSEPEGTGPNEPAMPSISQEKNVTEPTSTETSTRMPQPKPIGGRKNNAVTSNHQRNPPLAKPIRQPSNNRNVKQSPISPTTRGAKRGPISPRTEKPIVRGPSAKPMANRASSEQAKKLPTTPKETRRFSLSTQSSAAAAAATAARHGPSSPKSNGVKDTKRSSPEGKPPSARVPASATAPTAASAARTGVASTLQRKPTPHTTQRHNPPATHSIPTASTARDTRNSLPAEPNGTDSSKRKAGATAKAPTKGFLARMMRPTASSAQKTHDKGAPSSPPQSKQTAKGQAVKGKPRRSLTATDEDTGNSSQARQNGNPSPSAAEAEQVEPDGDGNGELRPLNDITSEGEPNEAITAENAPEALEAPSV